MTELNISVIIPVLHEASGINRIIGHIRTLEHGDSVEIIVIDGDAERSTIKAIQDPLVIKAVSGQGRSIQMNRGAALSSGEIMLFLHADTFLPHDAFVLIQQAMKDGTVAAGSFELGIDSDRWCFRITEAYVRLRTRLTKVPFGDQAIFVRKDFFNTIGGYLSIPLMEDVDLMRRIKSHGGRIAIVPRQVSTSARRWEKEGVLFCTIRNLGLQLLFRFGVRPEQLARWYKSQ